MMTTADTSPTSSLRTDMMHQVVSSTKFATAMFAGKWLFAFVDKDMSLKLIGVGEMGRAEVTLVWFLTSVHTKVTSEICHLYELPFAVRAVVPAKEKKGCKGCACTNANFS